MRNPLDVMRIRPLQYGHNDPISNTFGMVRAKRKHAHQGWDLLARPGTPVYAISDGELKVGTSSDYGNTVTIKFTRSGGRIPGLQLFAFYAHLAAAFQGNCSISEGTIIGVTGRTGNARKIPLAEAHLHFEIRLVEYLPKIKGGNPLLGRIDPGEVLGYGVYSSSPSRG